MRTTGSTLAVTTCTTTHGNTAVGLVVIALFIGAVVLFAVLNAQARGKLAAANAELAYLRPEVAWLRSSGGAGGPGASTWPTGAGWYPDPLRRHDHRHWSGTGWTDDVSDGGVRSRDPLSGQGT